MTLMNLTSDLACKHQDLIHVVSRASHDEFTDEPIYGVLWCKHCGALGKMRNRAIGSTEWFLPSILLDEKEKNAR